MEMVPRPEDRVAPLDDIGLTLRHADRIRGFAEQRRIEQPWLFAQ